MTFQVSKDAFARLAIEVLQKQGEARPITYDAAQFRLTIGGEGRDLNLVNLVNAYEEYCARPEIHRGHVLQHYFGRQTTELPPLDLSRVLPRIRDRAYYGLFHLQVRGAVARDAEDVKVPQMPHRPLGEHFGIGLVLDTPTTVIDVTQENLAELKLDFDAALSRAIDNLALLSVDTFHNPRPGVYVSPFHDSHDPARLLLTGKIRKLKVRGNPVAIFPNRTTLIVTGSNDDAGLSELADLAKEALLDPRPSNAIALELLPDGRWVPFLPADNARLALFFAQAQLRDYDTQQRLLREDFERRGHDVFVATFSALQNETTGAIRTYSTWSESVDTLLPRTDDLVFVRQQGQGFGSPMRVPWRDAEAIVGHRMKQEIDYPVRWRVSTFPSADELERLAAAAARAEAEVIEAAKQAPDVTAAKKKVSAPLPLAWIAGGALAGLAVGAYFTHDVWRSLGAALLGALATYRLRSP